MQSRMEKYQAGQKKRFERTKKNTELYTKVYDDIYSDTTYKNMSIIDSAKQVNINKLKNILDDKYDTRQYRTLKNYSNEDVELDDTYKPVQRDYQVYDINKILDDAKNKRAFIEEAKEKQKYLAFTEGRSTKYDDKYDELEKEEKELEELINTMAIPKMAYDEEDDLLSDLKGSDNTIVTNPIKSDLEKIDINEIDTGEIENESKTSSRLEKLEKTSRVDKTFYTDSNMFTKNDFDDFSTMSREFSKKHSVFKTIFIILTILLFMVAVYLVVRKFIIK